MKNSSGPKIDRSVHHGDHEVIYPKNELRLRALVRTSGAALMDEEPVGRAGQELGALAADFHGWVNDEVEKLSLAYEVYAGSPDDLVSQGALFKQAHDLKGNSGMLGYPLVGEAAQSLAKLLNALPPEFVPLKLVEHHIRSIRALASRAIHGADNPIALELVSELRGRTLPVIDAYQKKLKEERQPC